MTFTTRTHTTTTTRIGAGFEEGGRRGRWLEPFLLRLIAEGEVHGAALITQLDDLCLAPDGIDEGMAYRALRVRGGRSRGVDVGHERRAAAAVPAGRRGPSGTEADQ